MVSRKYKEKKFTKEQLKRISRIREDMDWLRKNNIQIEGKQFDLTFWRRENRVAVERYTNQNNKDIFRLKGKSIEHETWEIV